MASIRSTSFRKVVGGENVLKILNKIYIFGFYK